MNTPSSRESEVIASIAERIGSLSVEIADVVGHTQEVRSAINSQNTKLTAIGIATNEITAANHDISAMATQTSEAVGHTRKQLDSSNDSIRNALKEIGLLVSVVEKSRAELDVLKNAMTSVADVTRDIRAVAHQTNMLAINATIEAARAGEAGRGFKVVANEVKELARQTAESTARIDETLMALTNQVAALTRSMSEGATRATLVVGTAATIDASMGKVSEAVLQVLDNAIGIEAVTKNIATRCDEFRNSVTALTAEAERSTNSLESASGNLDRTLSATEAILVMTANSGSPTVDTPFIKKAQETARLIEVKMAEAIAKRELTVEDLFDKTLKPIEGTNPPQFMTRYIPFLDRDILQIIDPVLSFDKRMVFCAPTDHNGMIPCHNPDFRHPQGKELAWNAAHCRNRRVYSDRTAKAVAVSSEPFLLQTYRRDMGGGRFVLMKDASAPIFVEGKLWGGLRVCYSV